MTNPQEPDPAAVIPTSPVRNPSIVDGMMAEWETILAHKADLEAQLAQVNRQMQAQAEQQAKGIQDLAHILAQFLPSAPAVPSAPAASQKAPNWTAPAKPNAPETQHGIAAHIASIFRDTSKEPPVT